MGLAALGISYFFRREITDTGADIVGRVIQTRGFRNNNPGNIRKGQSWQGERVAQTDAAFEEFEAPAYGYRAMCRILDGYRSRYGARTVLDYINRWAPPSDNNPTSEYAAYVANHMDIDPRAYVDTRDPDLMIAMMDAITRFENNGANIFSSEDMRAGLDMSRTGVTYA